MNVSYVYTGGSAQSGEFRNAVLTGAGPSSYSQTTKDPLTNPGAGDYIAALPGSARTVSGTYRLEFVPAAAGQPRAGAASASQSGWTATWYVVSTGAQVANAVNLSTEVIQVPALITQL